VIWLGCFAVQKLNLQNKICLVINPVPQPATLTSLTALGSDRFQFTVRLAAMANSLIQANHQSSGSHLMGNAGYVAANEQRPHLQRHQRKTVPDAFLPGFEPVVLENLCPS
jgi:hypothetical protein